ncbi:MAG: ParB/RepB/Spo0J family partition protein [Betaproteobacteria bacterium]|nr:ParB/RepB/Spo0J family partition protein [Betaproteobacteria bacterium]
MKKNRRGLGRGLSELLGAGSEDESGTGTGTREVEIKKLQPGPWQPRRKFAKDALQEMAETMKKRGVLQPILVQRAGSGTLRIVAGERRWRAARLAGLKTVPVLVRDISDSDARIAALIENIQREDLQPLEHAAAARQLVKDLKLSLANAASELGMSRPALSNLLRLLELPPGVRKLLENEKITAGHARAVAGLPAARAEAVAVKAAAEFLSVRQTEELVARIQAAKKSKPDGKKSSPAAVDQDTEALCEELSDLLGMRVGIQHGRNNRGRMTIDYRSLDSLDGLIEMIRKARGRR